MLIDIYIKIRKKVIGPGNLSNSSVELSSLLFSNLSHLLIACTLDTSSSDYCKKLGSGLLKNDYIAALSNVVSLNIFS